MKRSYITTIAAITLLAACNAKEKEALGACLAYTSSTTKPNPNTWVCLRSQSTQESCEELYNSGSALWTRYNWKKGESC